MYSHLFRDVVSICVNFVENVDLILFKICLKSTDPWGPVCESLVYLPPIILPPRRAENANLAYPSPPRTSLRGCWGAALFPGFGPPSRPWTLLEPFFRICSAPWRPSCGLGPKFLSFVDAQGSIFRCFKGSVAWRSHLNIFHRMPAGITNTFQR